MDTPTVNDARQALIIDIAEQQIAQETDELDNWQQILEDANDSDDYDDIIRLAAKTIQLLQKDGVVEASASRDKVFQAIVANNPINWLIANFFNQPGQTAIEEDFSILEGMDSIDIPSLWIYGSYDVSVPPDVGQKAFIRINNHDKQFYLFNKSIHHAHDTEPRLFAKKLIDFVERYK